MSLKVVQGFERVRSDSEFVAVCVDCSLFVVGSVQLGRRNRSLGTRMQLHRWWIPCATVNDAFDDNFGKFHSYRIELGVTKKNS